MRLGGALERSIPAVPPAAGAAVMGTGIISTDLTLIGHETVSRVLLGIDIALWVGIGAALLARLGRDRARLALQARSPAALTGVAGTAVLGSRLVLLDAIWAGIALLVVALALYMALVGPVLGHWRTPTIGASFVLVVSTESLAALAAVLGHAERSGWLVVGALVPFALGLAFYVAILARFDLRQLLVGHGDHWVVGGALAISTFACGRIVLSARDFAPLGGVASALEVIAVAVWVAAIAWLPALLGAEALRPRLDYDVRRWSTVFPIGMYAACSIEVGIVTGAGGIEGFGRIWTWPALAVWAVVLVAMIARVGGHLRGSDPGARAPQLAPDPDRDRREASAGSHQ